MKILIVTNLYPPHHVGGYEIHCQLVARTLRERGHDVRVLTSDHQETGIEATGPEEALIQRALKIHGMFGHPWLGIQRLYALECHNNTVLRDTIRREQPDIVYAWNWSGLSKSMLFTLERTGVPACFSLCDHWIARSPKADVWQQWWNRPNPSLKNRLLRSVWTALGARPRCDLKAPILPVTDYRFREIHFCSRALRDFTAAAGFDVAHGRVIHSPAQTDCFTGTPRPASKPLTDLLYVGRLTEDKGVHTAVKAMEMVRNKFAGKLHIYGHGEPHYERALRQTAAAQRLPVEFHGGASSEKMPAIYAAHDALLFTSEWPEPFAMTPMEAMASGLPVIGTTTGGSAELFRHRENALTYTAGQPAELAQRILELDKDPDLRHRLAVTGQEEVRTRYNLIITANQAEDHLRHTVNTWRLRSIAA